ncbi:MAG: aminoacyl-tRNA hydrolase [Rickettsiales bacterium]
MATTLLIGLGNPGKEHAKDRHNAGFMAIDKIAEDWHFPPFKKAFGGAFADGVIEGNKLYLFKPMSYMNRSGGPASEVSNFYKIEPDHIIVIHDELDLGLGKLRVKKGGGHGGHNGLRDLDRHLGKDYLRVRFGIDHPGDKDAVSDYVLSSFAKAETPTVDIMISEISRHISLLLKGDEAEFMNKITLATSA